MNEGLKTAEGAGAHLGSEPDAWSYEWFGDADDGPTRWHRQLSYEHPTQGLPESYLKHYRNIRPLSFADVPQVATTGAGAPEPPDDGELEAWMSTSDALLRCTSSDAGLTRRAAHLLQNAYLFCSKLRRSGVDV